MKSTVQPTTPRTKHITQLVKHRGRLYACKNNSIWEVAIPRPNNRQKSRSTTGRGGKGGLGKSHVRKLHSKLAEAAEVLALKRQQAWDRWIKDVGDAMNKMTTTLGLLENFNVGVGLKAETPGRERVKCGKPGGVESCLSSFPCGDCPHHIPPRAKDGTCSTKTECPHTWTSTGYDIQTGSVMHQRCYLCGAEVWGRSLSTTQKCPSKPGQT